MPLPRQETTLFGSQSFVLDLLLKCVFISSIKNGRRGNFTLGILLKDYLSFLIVLHIAMQLKQLKACYFWAFRRTIQKWTHPSVGFGTAAEAACGRKPAHVLASMLEEEQLPVVSTEGAIPLSLAWNMGPLHIATFRSRGELAEKTSTKPMHKESDLLQNGNYSESRTANITERCDYILYPHQ